MPIAFAKIEDVLGAVLAGGGSRRMGQDKALMEVEGQTLLGRGVAVLETVLEEVVVVAPHRQRYVELRVALVPDVRPGLGPVGGMHAALLHGAGRPVFILACDMPLVTAELVSWIVGSRTFVAPAKSQISRPRARVVRDHHGAQPLCGLYSGGCLVPVERALEEGRLSAQALLNDLETEYLDLDPGADWYSPELLCNVNDVQDVTELTAALEQDP